MTGLWAQYMVWLDPDDQVTPDLLDAPRTAYIAVESKNYVAEQELAEKYRSFVSEILRLALAALAVFSFLNAYLHQSALVRLFACLGVILLACSIGRSLQFLFGASEGLRWYIVGLRYYKDSKEPEAEAMLKKRGEIIGRCRVHKREAAGFLLLGATAMALAILISFAIDLPKG